MGLKMNDGQVPCRSYRSYLPGNIIDFLSCNWRDFFFKVEVASISLCTDMAAAQNVRSGSSPVPTHDPDLRSRPPIQTSDPDLSKGFDPDL